MQANMLSLLTDMSKSMSKSLGTAREVSVPESAQAAFIAMLAIEGSPILVGTPSMAEAESLTRELKIWLGDAELLPPWETLPFERVSPAVGTMGERLKLLWKLRNSSGQPAAQPAPAQPAPAQPAPAQPAPARPVPPPPASAVVAPARSLVQKVMDSPIAPISLKAGESINREELIQSLVDGGYRRQAQVSARGEIGIRGSIVDIFPSTGRHSVRADFFGDSIERLCSFSLTNQLSQKDLSEVEIFPAREFLPPSQYRNRAAEIYKNAAWGGDVWPRLMDGEAFDGMESWLPWFLEEDKTPSDFGENILFLNKSEISLRVDTLLSEENKIAETLSETWGLSKNLSKNSLPRLHIPFETLEHKTRDKRRDLSTGNSDGRKDSQIGNWATKGPSLVPHISQLLSDGYRIVVCAQSQDSLAVLNGVLKEGGLAFNISPELPDRGSSLSVLPMGRGFIFHFAKTAFVSEEDLLNKKTDRLSDVRHGHKPGDQTGDTAATVTSAAWTQELKAGCFIVHKKYGIGRYTGTENKKRDDSEKEYLVLEYKGGDRLFVPAEQIGMLSIYMGGENPSLSSLGGTQWHKTTRRVKREVEEVARELVELYSDRLRVSGRSLVADQAHEADFDSGFLFPETPDQVKAIESVREDMKDEAPMDRLIYGDVGFGKTEVALRAVFRAVVAGSQAAVLAPTTLLARQHHEVFSERFRDFPVQVDLLSRLQSAAETKRILGDLKSGKTDVVIGTHRILSRDVKFANLGLLVVDEEQRFGVKHKESIKSMHKNIDVLTLTATPIPRTLEMSLTGIRDYSVISTPPTERHPVLTHIGRYDDKVVAEAIKREMLREGQVFFVHNRVADISETAMKLRNLVPEASVAVAHGQMDSAQMEEVVMDFWDKKHDVLVCTVIIESGIDMPNVNTLVVDRADIMGLGQLHQLRGRVGRAGVQAYAYLLYPPERILPPEAHERLVTISEATSLGSGFQIARRDLEIRGAGNLLGHSQSGYMAAVGYDLYCDMVREAIESFSKKSQKSRRKSTTGSVSGGVSGGVSGSVSGGTAGATAELTPELTPESAAFSETSLSGIADVVVDLPFEASLKYIADEALRLEAYRSLFLCDEERLELMAEEWADRFGALDEPAQNLLWVAKLRLACARNGITKISATNINRAHSAIRPVADPIYKFVFSPLDDTAGTKFKKLFQAMGYEAAYSQDTDELILKSALDDNILRDFHQVLTGQI